jgi:hypothetical protein
MDLGKTLSLFTFSLRMAEPFFLATVTIKTTAKVSELM